MKDGAGGLEGASRRRSSNCMRIFDTLLPVPDFQFSKHLGFPSLLNVPDEKKGGWGQQEEKICKLRRDKSKTTEQLLKPNFVSHKLFSPQSLCFHTSSQSSRNIALAWSCSVFGLICSEAFGRVPVPPRPHIPDFPPVCTWLTSALDWILLSR